MGEGEAAQLKRQGEGHQKVVDRQQLLALTFQPLGGLVVLARRATAVAARARAPFDLTTAGAAGQDLARRGRAATAEGAAAI
jgi:hypothetical protein